MRVLSRLLGHLKRHWRLTAGAYLCLGGSTLLGLVVPWVIKEAIDRGLLGNRPAFLLQAALIVVVASAAKAAFSLSQSYLGERLSQKIAYDLRGSLYNQYQRLGFSFHDRSQTGDLMSRATNDVESVRLFFGVAVVNLANIALMLFAISAILLSMNWQLALVALAMVPLLAVRAVAMGRSLRPMFRAVQDQFGRMSTVLQENLAGVRVVKAFAREPYETEKFDRESYPLYQKTLAAVRSWAINFPFMSFLVSLATALILLFGGRQVAAGVITVGTLVAFNGYVVMLSWPVRQLGWIVNIMARAASSGERILEVLDAEPEVREAPHPRRLKRAQGVVRFENVSFRYQGPPSGAGKGLPVLEDVSLEARPGEVMALVGAPGSGKSTLVHLIPRFYDATAGRVTLDGCDVRELELSWLRRRVGIVLQEPFLFSASLGENIAFGMPEAGRAEIEEAAQRAQLHDFIASLPEGYDTLVGERGITLSGGQRQRVAIARALLIDPLVLILDDSTSSVDTETEHALQLALRNLMRGRTTFVIAHRLLTVRQASQILVLEKGRIVERGRHQELLARGGFYRRIYELQLKDQEEAHRLALSAARAASP